MRGEKVVYIATCESRPEDREMAERIDRHRKRRPSSWRTEEEPWPSKRPFWGLKAVPWPWWTASASGSRTFSSPCRNSRKGKRRRFSGERRRSAGPHPPPPPTWWPSPAKQAWGWFPRPARKDLPGSPWTGQPGGRTLCRGSLARGGRTASETKIENTFQAVHGGRSSNPSSGKPGGIMTTLEQAIARIRPLCAPSMEEARRRQDSLTKPRAASGSSRIFPCSSQESSAPPAPLSGTR